VRVELLDTMSADWERRVRQRPVRGISARTRERIGRGVASPDERSASPEDAPLAVPDGGVVDFTGNWWGKEATAEMEEKGADGNVSSILDGRDEPKRRYPGDEGEYESDRVDFSGWTRKPLPGTGPEAWKPEGEEP
jgi:hypothetical protein